MRKSAKVVENAKAGVKSPAQDIRKSASTEMRHFTLTFDFKKKQKKFIISKKSWLEWDTLGMLWLFIKRHAGAAPVGVAFTSGKAQKCIEQMQKALTEQPTVDKVKVIKFKRAGGRWKVFKEKKA